MSVFLKLPQGVKSVSPKTYRSQIGRFSVRHFSVRMLLNNVDLPECCLHPNWRERESDTKSPYIDLGRTLPAHSPRLYGPLVTSQWNFDQAACS